MISATIEGVDVTIAGLESVGVDGREAAYYAVIEVLKIAFDACKTTISADDHTLRALAELGHPYGHKHPATIHDPDVIVHEQSGGYLGALTADPPIGGPYEILEGKIYIAPPFDQLDRWLQEGTSKMRARPWMEYVCREFGEDWADIIEARIMASMERAA
jgi:hypothetical protein